ncbi:porin [Vibrio cincinnatiensis]|uniref:porin n=1 Tax=Vibrio cincinnatiensis TaxID=675 RepID=UPI001EE06D14|nr:porin [Vibrio cincinnatiensis]MCG3731933.1 porin [Vibrio cincinnatiensis]MCG3739327.1 porin [Vibrio cincinnatiensis]MCG3743268.1 porin [Vibrio cincinnatiensis]
MRVINSRKSVLPLALSAVFLALPITSQAARIYTAENGDYMDVFGEVGVGGYFGTKAKYKQYHSDDSYIDDTFATFGSKGRVGIFDYRIELDYERENWRGGSGDMELHIDKAWLGYRINQYHYLEFGLTDTAFDDYDAYGDLTFDTGAETGEAGDQDKTIKYEGNYQNFAVGLSYSYKGKSSSGQAQGNITNGYVGYFGDEFSMVLGAERRNGSAGESKYGLFKLYGVGLRYAITDQLLLGLNGFIEYEEIGECTTTSDPWVDPAIKVCNRYQEFKNQGGLVSFQYSLNERWDLVGSANYEAYKDWDRGSQQWGGDDALWEAMGRSRTFHTIGVRYKPSRSSVIEIEGNIGEAYQDAYAKATVFF